MRADDPFDDPAAARAVIAADGTVTRWNEGARQLLGHRAEDVVGRPAALLLADGAQPPPPPAGPRWSGTLALRHRDGGTVTVWMLAHRGRPEDGDTEGWLAVTPLPSGRTDPTGDPVLWAAMVQSPCATVVFDTELRLHGANDAMADLLGLPASHLRGLTPSDIGGRPRHAELERHMTQVLRTGRGHDVQTRVQAFGKRQDEAWLARIAPLTDDAGRVVGVCVTAHDFTEQSRARARLQLVNEASMRIGTTLDVTRTAQELTEVCVPALADFVSVDLLEHDHGADPTGPLTLPVPLRRVAHRSRTAGSPESVADVGEVVVYPAAAPQADSLIAGHSVVASVPSGDLDPWLAVDDARARQVREFGVHSMLSVPLQARGVTLGVAAFTRFRHPEHFTHDDVLLAEEITARAAVCIDNARRYSRERGTTLTLQRSLLPRGLPRTAAVDAASRYLPAARTGVGGDWFDVIPLSGMRVAMVVGDVAGHGIQASATMGRLRTAVRTLADIDLAPEELLTHLDDLVLHLSHESGGDAGPGEVGATCLYAVYDPVSRRCTLSRAGHPPPVLVPPGGPVRMLDMPSGPPLGLGGLPFESVEVELPEGSVLAFYTDGLVDGRGDDSDADAGSRMFCDALSHATPGSLDEACDRVLHAMLQSGPATDDVALLLTRTRGLPSSQVATWDIPADPSLVAPVRKQVLDQLGVWALTEASFTVELVVSELVTNAIRYGAPPIRLRLISDASTLICEVSDTSHTAPHLRRAKTWDEGGRGLLLVAQLTQRWGSRHTAEGKTIWAELGLAEEL
ncbi:MULTISPECIES: SpoIIE family protein phosphatase [unclassified Streptomyces]|uniref:SpoIIE family protein phosphatase n=1 Tax=unclassified Streptomyces TaxID=2593676 RepID=UPI00073C536D|nr:SpoIIE family protein phosphatase [Streptomyces sp. AVP053U2]ODA70329.1 Phosphoserine phosphatase RsbU [Streptomyces sp. AVP053U2]